MEELFFFNELEKQMSDEQNEQLYDYYLLIKEYNQQMNLTGIDDYQGVYLKHFYDSLTLIEQINKYMPATIADLGTGAGFPGIVLAIFYPDITFYLIEPLTKRINFLQVVIDNLNLSNVILINERAENINDKYDMVVSRAVANLQILCEIAYGLIKRNGYFIALKGLKAEKEIESASNALKVLDLEIIEKDKLILPIEKSVRYNIVIKKKSENIKYPRNYSQIKKKPL